MKSSQTDRNLAKFKKNSLSDYLNIPATFIIEQKKLESWISEQRIQEVYNISKEELREYYAQENSVVKRQ